VYLRVSQDRNGKAKSVKEQAHEYGLDAADNPLWVEVGRYTDNDRSASRFAAKERPEFNRMVADIEAGRVDQVWMWAVSRQSRDLATFVPLRDLCREKGITWYVHSEERLYDFTKRSDVKQVTRSAVDAEESSEETSVLVRRSIRANLRDGRPHGNVPYGYRRRYHEHSKELIAQDPHPQRAAIVVEICTRYAAGESLNALRLDLTRRKVPCPGDIRTHKDTRPGYTPTPWNATTVRDIATSTVYIGRRTYRGSQRDPEAQHGQVYVGDWPALISVELHEQCVRRMRKVAEQPWPRTSRPRHLLSTVMCCCVCGEGVGVQHRPDRPVYRCPTGHVVVAQDYADEVVISAIAAWIERNRVARSVLRADVGEQVHAAREAYAEAEREWKDLVARADREEISVGAFAALEPGKLARRKAAEEALERLTMPGVLVDLLSDTSEPDPRRRFLARPVGVRRDILRLVWQITLQRTGKGRKPTPEVVAMVPRELFG